jgi:uncharacterized protein YhbP (UPF0306 family)
MPNIKQQISDYLKTARVMQLATSVNDKPWICTVHFYSHGLTIYWSSMPDRRHSREIEQNKNAAVAIKIHEDTPDEKYVIGISLEGKVEKVTAEEMSKIGPLYIKKLDKEPTFIEDILSGKKDFVFYKLLPTNAVLFDTITSGNPRQEIAL